MSLDYDFSIATPLSPQRVLRIALLELGLMPNTDRTAEGVFKESTGPGFLVSAGPMGTPSRRMLEEALHVSPDVDLRFWLDALGDRHSAQTSMLRGILAALGQIPGDAVLTFSGEKVLLLRRGGRMYLEAETGVWTPDRLRLVQQPYEMKNFPVL
ncbi:SitI3 family protein [Melittangium boletus]|uniref:Uncharacterized protein n=1 Tax=Melittangium boletus DSM 14713 TaxID=1294270 RepID=A0A250IG42_9BACT|nr:SitI3 family protein [Melittangium boletus]ATB30121.1 hypothetical protein MEBOL_003576 [Melittangium boletus DSM 14713]